MRRVMLVLGLVLSMLVLPTRAYASVEDYETALMTPEQLYDYEYRENGMYGQEVLLSEPVRDALPDDATTTDYVNDYTSKVYSLNWYGVGSRSWLDSLRLMLVQTNYLQQILVAAIAIVFMWWGLRKTYRMYVKAFRGGRINW